MTNESSIRDLGAMHKFLQDFAGTNGCLPFSILTQENQDLCRRFAENDDFGKIKKDKEELDELKDFVRNLLEIIQSKAEGFAKCDKKHDETIQKKDEIMVGETQPYETNQEQYKEIAKLKSDVSEYEVKMQGYHAEILIK